MSQILIIEDDQLILDSILDFLEIEDFKVTGTTSGQEGLQLAAQIHPDIILCDIMMLEQDGFEVLENLKKNPAIASIPFIFMSAIVEASVREKGLEMGAKAFLPKPFNRLQMLDVIRSYLPPQYSSSSHAVPPLLSA